MRVTQLDIARDDGTTLHVRFGPGLNVVDRTADDLSLIADALRTLFGGSVEFGRAFISVEDIEIEVTDEMAHLLPESIAAPIIDLATVRPDRGPNVIAIRAALELLEEVSSVLSTVDVDAALAATRDEHDMAENHAALTLTAATDALDSARARQQAVYDATAPVLAARRGWRHQKRLAEASAARDHVDECVDLASAAVAQARREADDVRLRTGGNEQLRALVAREYCLALRRGVGDGTLTLTDPDRRALRTALTVLRPIDDRRLFNDPVLDAAAWLEHHENRGLDQAVLASAARNCQPHPVLGVMPLIVAPSDTHRVEGLRDTVGTLTSELQVIHLGELAA